MPAVPFCALRKMPAILGYHPPHRPLPTVTYRYTPLPTGADRLLGWRQVAALSSIATSELPKVPRAQGGLATCVGIARSGVPVRDELWNSSTCGGSGNKRSKSPLRIATVTPLLVPSSEGGREGL